MKLSIWKYKTSDSKDGPWVYATYRTDTGHTKEQVLIELKNQFPGKYIAVELISTQHIETPAETKKSTKEIGEAAFKAMKERLKK